MVIAFLVFCFMAEIIGFALLTNAMSKSDATSFIPGWLLGLFTAATGYVLFYQIFPAEVL